jgi:cell division protein FtsN
MKQQRGGLVLGLIIGVVIGLGGRTGRGRLCDQGAGAVHEQGPEPHRRPGRGRSPKKNKDWDPNAPLYGKNPVRPAPAASGAVSGTPEAAAPAASAPRAGASASQRTAKQEVKPAVTGDPLGDLAKAKSAGSTAATAVAGGATEPFLYFIQAGAYRTPEDAEAQRAKLSLIGLEAKVTEREQSGRTVYRVRVGPFEKQGRSRQAEGAAGANGVETALVRQQR